MSKQLRIPLKTRWTARSAVLKRWLIEEGKWTTFGTPICEIDVDGNTQVIRSSFDDEPRGLVTAYTSVGCEIGPKGRIADFSSAVPNLDPTEHEHFSARRRFRRRSQYPAYFISYRRADSEAYAWRLHESLSGRFGADAVFIDEFSIRPGEPFAWTIQQAAISCAAMLVLIGPSWFDTGQKGTRRIDNEADFLRLEVSSALETGKLVMPVLVGGAPMFNSDQLPSDLEELTELQVSAMSSKDWARDVSRLVEHLEELQTTVATAVPASATKECSEE